MQTVSVLLIPATFSGKMLDCLNEILLEFGRKNVRIKESNKDDAFRIIEFREMWNEDKDLIMSICATHNMLPIFIYGESSLATLRDATTVNLYIDK